MRNGQKCSHCGIIGHNLRTCTARQPRAGMGIGTGTAGSVNSVKLFGVLIDVPSSSPAAENQIEKRSLNKDSSNFSALSLVPSMSSSTSSSSSFPRGCSNENQYEFAIGCLSDHLILGRIQQERKKSVSWSKEEHRRFLAGLEKLGKGDWRGISKKFVATRTPSQVASHAQKYFLKQNNNKSYTFKEKHLPNFSHVAKKDGDSKLMSPSNGAPIHLCCPPS